MKNPNEILLSMSGRKFSEIYTGTHQPKKQISENDKYIVDKLFNEFTNTFPAWRNNIPDAKAMSEIKVVWIKAFIENDINSTHQIDMGLAKARKSGSDFLPSTGKFISWCKPNPEDMGWPSNERAKMLCIAHRSKEKLNMTIGIATRPLIIRLCDLVDWWLMETGTTKADFKRSDEHFEKKYLELIDSGYQEPKETSSPRLETSEITKPRMSEQQEIDRQNRGMSALAGIRKQLKTQGN